MQLSDNERFDALSDELVIRGTDKVLLEWCGELESGIIRQLISCKTDDERSQAQGYARALEDIRRKLKKHKDRIPGKPIELGPK